MNSRTFVFNSPPVTHQTIDGEVVIINLQNGSYYSLRDTAATIWALVEQGADLERIVGFFRENYKTGPDSDGDELQNCVTAFINALCDEGLIAENPYQGNVATPSQPAPVPCPVDAVFRRPEFEKYDDLQDLVMLDPIHQVSEQGWPHPKEDE